MNSTDEVDRWIRNCAYDVGFTKGNTFVGQTMFIQNFVRSFGVMLATMTSEGLITDMKAEAVRRSAAGEEGGKSEGKANERITLVPKSIPKPKSEDAVKSRPEDLTITQNPKTEVETKTTAITEGPTIAQIFDFSSISLGPPTKLEAPKHTFYFQHKVLTTAQHVLESACYRFSGKNYPSILSRNRWRCPEAGELTAWTKELIQSYEADPKPVAASVYNPGRFPQVLKDLSELRHTTVHRIEVSSKKLSALLKSAFDAVKMFKDDVGINDIALLFHGQSDCLKLSLEAGVQKDTFREETEDRIKIMEKELKRFTKRLNWQKDRIESLPELVGKIDEVYENVLENQLDWMCSRGKPRKSFDLINEEFHTEMTDAYELFWCDSGVDESDSDSVPTNDEIKEAEPELEPDPPRENWSTFTVPATYDDFDNHGW